MPGLNRVEGIGRHGAGVTGDARAVEGRLDHAALPQVKGAVAGDQPVPDDRLEVDVVGAFLVVAVVGHQDVLDGVGMDEKVEIAQAEAQVSDVAQLGSGADKLGQPLTAHLRADLQARRPLHG